MVDPGEGTGGPGSFLFLDQNGTRKVQGPTPTPSLAEGLDPPLECLGFIYALTSIGVLVLLFRKVKSIRFADYSDPLEIDY